MKRRNFITVLSAGSGGMLLTTPLQGSEIRYENKNKNLSDGFSADVVIAGGGMGGCATALAACRNGLNVIMTEETDWIGGQLSQQGVPLTNTSGLKRTGRLHHTAISETACGTITNAIIP